MLLLQARDELAPALRQLALGFSYVGANGEDYGQSVPVRARALNALLSDPAALAAARAQAAQRALPYQGYSAREQAKIRGLPIRSLYNARGPALTQDRRYAAASGGAGAGASRTALLPAPAPPAAPAPLAGPQAAAGSSATVAQGTGGSWYSAASPAGELMNCEPPSPDVPVMVQSSCGCSIFHP